MIELGVRWTIGDVSGRGVEALRLSMWGAWRVFGDRAAYAVCVNSVGVGAVRERVGDVPMEVAWRAVDGAVPGVLREFLDAGMAEGVAWKLMPLRVFERMREVSLDNDVILWAMPGAMREWLACGDAGQCLMAEDVKACFGRFARWCGDVPRNAGIRGLPAGFDLGAALGTVLRRAGEAEGAGVMTSETDEQGLQTAALSVEKPVVAVGLEDVTICSPFWPHMPELGRCGAHFVGLNARHIAWDYYDRPADAWMREHWGRHYEEVRRRVGAPERRDGGG